MIMDFSDILLLIHGYTGRNYYRIQFWAYIDISTTRIIQRVYSVAIATNMFENWMPYMETFCIHLVMWQLNLSCFTAHIQSSKNNLCSHILNDEIVSFSDRYIGFCVCFQIKFCLHSTILRLPIMFCFYACQSSS